MKNVPARISSFWKVIQAALLLGFVIFSLTSPNQAQADATSPCPPNQAITEVGCLPKDPIQFVSSFYTIGLGLIGGVALIFIIIGGYTILTSRGSPTQINVGKSYIFYAILGLLLAIFGYIFIEVFAIDILHLPGFSQ